ncbi:hypothetical protein AZI87_01725 [Bdellovibrio bacteriovorus]|uniref:PepSY domain-containing protein n=1 Tax=Bdellovibrio bacteriovorus TaxID=959 RepID=A0A162GFE7_BDEBC|nr:hypothetical protein [Bdellovibrio bacteriovorus]KYG68015.1 hypothetical protein AZI87_01725 [Bdellovibrio bacteriovorus]
MKSILALFVLLSSAQSFAANPCENHAKAAAIRTYKAAVGTVQGSEGIQYSSVKEEGWNNPYLYTVTIADNNEDGETWEVDYEVQVQDKAGKCKVLSVKEVASR